MASILTVLTASILALYSLSAVASDTLPRVVFPAEHPLPIDAHGVITTNTAILQVELQPGLIVSAQRGTQFSVSSVDAGSDSIRLQVLRGRLITADLRANAVTQLAHGRYLIQQKQGFPPVINAEPDVAQEDRGPAAMDPEFMTPGYRLSDAVMVQQQKYLDSLKVDVRDINTILASILRSLVPRRP